MGVRQEIREESYQHVTMIRNSHENLKNTVSWCLNNKNYTPKQEKIINSNLTIIEDGINDLQDLFFNEKFDVVNNYSSNINKKIQDLKEYLNCTIPYSYPYEPHIPITGMISKVLGSDIIFVIMVAIIIVCLSAYLLLTKSIKISTHPWDNYA